MKPIDLICSSLYQSIYRVGLALVSILMKPHYIDNDPVQFTYGNNIQNIINDTW
ncbi:19237_t:CDS:2 [Cetraspora pellucida]|uniref:19237_t:CDS:1 n=1 Tax=Cetraspora pellucida TaxID=1433469 RepID=A0A9N9E4K1_9GLOM|nr:19237_t:CDS:2 [Cetraspora pellucida]